VPQLSRAILWNWNCGRPGSHQSTTPPPSPSSHKGIKKEINLTRHPLFSFTKNIETAPLMICLGYDKFGMPWSSLTQTKQLSLFVMNSNKVSRSFSLSCLCINSYQIQCYSVNAKYLTTIVNNKCCSLFLHKLNPSQCCWSVIKTNRDKSGCNFLFISSTLQSAGHFLYEGGVIENCILLLI